MAQLKAETTVGGSLVWTQGNFPLFPTGNTLVYKTYKVYSEYDKPQAVDNDFVSKADGGAYLSTVELRKNLVLAGAGGTVGNINSISLYGGTVNGQVPNYGTFVGSTTVAGTGGVVLGSHGKVTGNWSVFNVAANGGWIFRNTTTNVASITNQGVATFDSVIVNSSPSEAGSVTRKDYVDNAINIVTNNANDRVLRSGDTMTGVLTAPNFVSTNKASLPTQLTRLDQVVPKGVTIDFDVY